MLIWVEDAALAAAGLVPDGSAAEEIRVALHNFALLAAWPFGRPALVVMLAATAFALLRTRALPLWSAWLAVAAGLANLVFTAGLFVDEGPLSPATSLAK